MLAWLIGGTRVADPVILGSAAAGVLRGFAGAYVLTELLPRRNQAPVEKVAKGLEGLHLAMMPLRQGGGISLSTRLH